MQYCKLVVDIKITKKQISTNTIIQRIQIRTIQILPTKNKPTDDNTSADLHIHYEILFTATRGQYVALNTST